MLANNLCFTCWHCCHGCLFQLFCSNIRIITCEKLTIRTTTTLSTSNTITLEPNKLAPDHLNKKLNISHWPDFTIKDTEHHGINVSPCDNNLGRGFLATFASQPTLCKGSSSIKCFAHPSGKQGMACFAKQVGGKCQRLYGCGARAIAGPCTFFAL